MQVQGAKEFFSLFLILVPRVGNCWKVLSNGVTWSDVLFKERAWLCISGFTGELEQAFSTLAGLTFGPDKSLLMRGPVHCRVCCSIPDLYPLGAAVTSSLSRDKKTVSRHCCQDILGEDSSWLRTTELEWMQGFLCFPGKKFSSPGLRDGGGAEMNRWDCRDQEMNSTALGWTDPSRWSSPQCSLSASLLQHSTCSKERIWSCVGDIQCWMAKDSMWNVKFSFTLL